MTCVLQPTSITFPTSPSDSSMRWSPMTPSSAEATQNSIGLSTPNSHYNSNAAAEAAFRKTADGSIKKRASRAGTRSVSTLSAAQLERKRANDREAQRAIRQRTKTHIDDLEKTLSDLKHTLENREKLLNAAHQRTRELEDENAILRMRLSDPNISATANTKYTRHQEQTNASAPASAVSETSGSHRSGSISNAAGFALSNGTTTNGINGTWHQQAQFANTNGTMMISNNADATRNMTGWRARDSPTTINVPPATDNVHGLHPPQAIPYTPTTDRSQWTSNHYDINGTGQQAQQFQQQQVNTQNDAQFSQANFQHTSQGQAAFHPPLLLPQGDFQAINHNFYQFPPQNQNFSTQQAQFHAQSGQGQAQIQPSPVSAASYHSAAEHAINQAIHPPMQFRDDAEFRGYTMNHFPAG